MKKLVLFLLLSVFSFVMISCEGGVTLPSGITTDEDWFTTEETTGGEVTTTDGVTTEVPTTNDGTTSEGTTTEVPTTIETTTEAQSTEDRLSEIAAMTSYLSSSGMMISDSEAFATELYDKGMRTAGLINMMSEIANLQSIPEQPTMQDGFEIIDEMMGNMQNNQIQAFLSAMVKVELRNSLQAQLTYLNGMTEEQKAMYMGDYEQEVMMLDMFITMIEENGDDVVMSAMVVVEYLMDVEALLTTEFIGQIETLANQSAFLPEHILAIYNIKNQIIGYLSNSLPSAEDVVVFDSTVITFLEMLTMDEIDFSLIDVETFANQQLATVELMFSLIETMDQSYIEELINLAQSNGDPVYAKLFIIENIKMIDTFFSSNEAEIQALRDMTTLQERSDLFNNFILDEALVFALSQSMDETMVNEMMTLIHAAITYEDIDGLPLLFSDVFNDLIDEIRLSNYQIIEDLFAGMMLMPEDFATMEEYYQAMNLAGKDVIISAIELLDPVVENRTASEYQMIFDLMISGLTLATQGQIDFSLLDTETMGIQEMMSMNLVFDFLTSRDLDYDAALDAMITNPNDPMVAKAFIIENIDLLHSFLTNNQTEIDALLNETTLQERSDVFYNFLIGEVLPFILMQEGMDATTISEITTYLTTAIDYETLEGVPIIFTDAFMELLDGVVLSEYDVVEKMFTLQMINPDDYATWEEYYDVYDPAEFDMIMSIIELVEPIIASGTQEEYQTIIDTVFMGLNLVANIEDMTTEKDMSNVLTVISMIEVAFDNTTSNQWYMIQDIAHLAVTTTYFTDVFTLVNDDTMTEEEFGVNMAILVANIINDVHTTIQTDFDTVKAEVLSILNNPDFVLLSDVTQAEIDYMIEVLNGILPDVIAQASTIKDYTYATITTTQIEEIQTFMTDLGMLGNFPQVTDAYNWRAFLNDWEGTYGSLNVIDGQAVLELYELNVYQGWHVQIIQDAFAMGGEIDNEGSMQFEAGRTYRLTFDASSSIAGDINIAIGHSEGGWTPYYMEVVSVTTDMATYVIEFTLDDTSVDYTTLAQLKFELGSLFNAVSAPQHFVLDNVVLEVLDTDDVTYVDAGLVSNGDFSATPYDEGPMYTDAVDWRAFFNEWEGTYGSLNAIDGQAVLELYSMNVYEPWHVQIIQDMFAMGGDIDNEGSMQFEAGQTYRVTFDAMASVEGDINVAIGYSIPSWVPYHLEVVSVTTEMMTYSFEFTLDPLGDYTTLAQLKFELGSLFYGLEPYQFFILDNVHIEVFDGTNYVDAGLVSNGDFSAISFEPMD